jgi:ketosteroid isomerase-like protein
VVLGVALLALLGGWVMVRAYGNPSSDECLSRYQAARTAADSALVDSFVPGNGTSRNSCGFMRAFAAPIQDSAAVHAVAAGIIAADNAGDIVTVLGYYADSAMLLPPNEPPVAGITEIRHRYEGLFNAWQPAIEGRVDEVVVSGEMAWVRGHNGGTLRSLTPGTADRALDDTYLMTLRRRGGTWQIARLMWLGAQPKDAK